MLVRATNSPPSGGLFFLIKGVSKWDIVFSPIITGGKTSHLIGYIFHAKRLKMKRGESSPKNG